jgi:hypothetical protein
MKRLLFVALFALMGCSLEAQVPSFAAAVTYCNEAGEAESAFKHTVFRNPAWLAAVLAHEAKHREQISRYPTCKIAQMFYDFSIQVRLDNEAEAYCTGLHAGVAAGGSREDYLEYTIRSMERSFLWFGVNHYEIARALDKHGCFRA